jgi:hypothetical protein
MSSHPELPEERAKVLTPEQIEQFRTGPAFIDGVGGEEHPVVEISPAFRDALCESHEVLRDALALAEASRDDWHRVADGRAHEIFRVTVRGNCVLVPSDELQKLHARLAHAEAQAAPAMQKRIDRLTVKLHTLERRRP